MRKDYKWAEVSYNLVLYDDTMLSYNKIACFTYIRDFKGNKLNYIELLDISCEKSKNYTILYLNYITDMLKLEDVEIKEDSFKFKAFNNNIKNMFVCSLVRFLFENIGYQIPPLNQEELFFKPLLKTGKCKYRNKLKRFCYFYKELGELKNFHTGHSWKPHLTKIKSTKDFTNYNFSIYNNDVNSFFIR